VKTFSDEKITWRHIPTQIGRVGTRGDTLTGIHASHLEWQESLPAVRRRTGRWFAPWCTHVAQETKLVPKVAPRAGPQCLQELRYFVDSGLESHVTALDMRIKRLHDRR